ncbi:MAG: tyrosine-type recombinase/integrase, partial [bacterium]
TTEDAAGYMATLQGKFARKTIRDNTKLLNKAFERFLPVGTANPFSTFVGHWSSGDSDAVHRKPFTPEELEKLLAAARDDEFMYPLIVTAACSGMRRGDVCGLTWTAVDLAGGMLTVKTSKTGAQVEIPIFKPLRDVLSALKDNGSKYVFPEAASLLRNTPHNLTWRFKKIVAKAFESSLAMSHPSVPIAVGTVEEGIAAITTYVPEGTRRDRMLDTFRRYMSGEATSAIFRATGNYSSLVACDMRRVEALTGKSFCRTPGSTVKRAVQLATQEPREIGHRAASVRDWHALRATFVTLALTAGVPIELVRRITGHSTVEIILKHYFRPNREHFRAALLGAMPHVLTGGKPARLKPTDELLALVMKLCAGSATEQDKERLRALAAKV